MPLTELKSNVKKAKKRIGRGNGSGHGTFSGKGVKGQTARAGGKRRPGFEGGQTPFLRKMPKVKGFKNPNRVEYQAVNVYDLNIFDDNAKIKKEDLLKRNIISKKNLPVKLLGKGELEKTINIEVDKASKEALKKIEEKKGKVTLLEANKAKKNV